MTSKIYALNIGVAKVDETHYQHKLAPLACCETDAIFFNQLGSFLKYDKQKLLINETATVAQVTETITDYSKALVAGDLCIITYSGHGAKMVDLDGDEDTLTDKTWCLYDRQLIDDELPHLWKLFKKGVHVLVLLDSCHSGTAIKGFTEEQPKILKNSKSIFLENKALYLDIIKQEKVKESEVQCSVLLVAACQDNEEALSGTPLSYFTRIFLKALCQQNNALNNYKSLFQLVNEQSTREKEIRPNYLPYGQSTTFFDSTKPFLNKKGNYPEGLDTFYADLYIKHLKPKEMTIYALLIGINDYPTSPLGGCVGDVEKMEAYLDGLKNDNQRKMLPLFIIVDTVLMSKQTDDFLNNTTNIWNVWLVIMMPTKIQVSY